MTEEAFRQAAQTYSDTIYRVAYHALKHCADAEDVAVLRLIVLLQVSCVRLKSIFQRQIDQAC